MSKDKNGTNDKLIIDDIINGKDDISEHYLDKDNKQFKIFRYEKNVYAVRYNQNTSEPSDFVPMWRSHKGESQSEVNPPEIGRGVYKKTIDKAFKREVCREIIEAVEYNNSILEQKFLLKENNIEQYFALGLWNIKSNDIYNLAFNMPLLNSVDPKEMDKDLLMQKHEEIVLALKKINELGYTHDDIATYLLDDNSMDGVIIYANLDNIMLTHEGSKFVDLDYGLSYDESRDCNTKDQWIYLHNFMDKDEPLFKWKRELHEWYKVNKGQSISDHPNVLRRLQEGGKILLPRNWELTKNLEHSEVIEKDEQHILLLTNQFLSLIRKMSIKRRSRNKL